MQPMQEPVEISKISDNSDDNLSPIALRRDINRILALLDDIPRQIQIQMTSQLMTQQMQMMSTQLGNQGNFSPNENVHSNKRSKNGNNNNNNESFSG